MPVEDLGAARESPPYGPGADEGLGGRRRPVPEVVGRRELGDDEPIGMSSLRRSGRLPQETIAIVWLVGFFLWVLMLYGSALVLRTTSLHDLEDLLRNPFSSVLLYITTGLMGWFFVGRIAACVRTWRQPPQAPGGMRDE